MGPIMMDVAGVELEAEDRDMLRHPLVGGVILFTRNYSNPEQLGRLVASIRECREAMLIAVDYEGGRVQRFREGFTPIPAMRRLGELYDQRPEQALELASICGWMIATELGGMGIDLAFAPVLDLDAGLSSVIGDRAFHADPVVVARLAIRFMQGMHEAGMAATGKHFPGHGQVVPDSHQELPVDAREREDLTEDMAPFGELIAAGLKSVMMAHIQFPKVDPLPSSLSRYWVTDCLRGELGFSGSVFSDDLSMGGAAVCGDALARTELALQAGCDMLPICNDRHAVMAVLDGLKRQPDERAQAGLTALRGRPVLTGDWVTNADWQQRQSALDKIII